MVNIFKKIGRYLHETVQELFFVDLMARAVYKGDLKRIDLLVKLGADVNHIAKEDVKNTSYPNNGYHALDTTILFKGCGYAFAVCPIVETTLETFLHLVKKGLNPNQCINGRNLLASHLHVFDAQEISRICETGIDLNGKKGCDPVAWSIASINSDITIRSYNEFNDVQDAKIAALIKAGMDINARRENGETVAHEICSGANRYTEFILGLARHGLDLEIKDNTGRTPLDCFKSKWHNSPQAAQELEAFVAGKKQQRTEKNREDLLQKATRGLTAEEFKSIAERLRGKTVKISKRSSNPRLKPPSE